MEQQELSEHFWNDRYEKCETGWDIGHISTPLKDCLLYTSDAADE